MAKPKFYSNYAKAIDSKGNVHYVTVVAKVEQGNEKFINNFETRFATGFNQYKDCVISFEDKRFYRTMTLAASICCPQDKFNKKVGTEIAKRRLKNGDILGQITTNNVTMLTEDAVFAEILTKLTHIVNNIDDYFPAEDNKPYLY